MKNNLAVEVARVLELDAKRMPGVITVGVPNARVEHEDHGLLDHELKCGFIIVGYTFDDTDADFFAASSTMADIIRQQQALLVEAREALRGMNAIYDTDGDHSFADGDTARRKSGQTLTRLQAATKE